MAQAHTNALPGQILDDSGRMLKLGGKCHNGHLAQVLAIHCFNACKARLKRSDQALWVCAFLAGVNEWALEMDSKHCCTVISSLDLFHLQGESGQGEWKA